MTNPLHSTQGGNFSGRMNHIFFSSGHVGTVLWYKFDTTWVKLRGLMAALWGSAGMNGVLFLYTTKIYYTQENRYPVHEITVIQGAK